MAICQVTNFSYFYHIMRSYLLPQGDGIQLFSLFVLPITGGLILMELSGAAGLLLLSKDNVLKTATPSQ